MMAELIRTWAWPAFGVFMAVIVLAIVAPDIKSFIVNRREKAEAGDGK